MLKIALEKIAYKVVETDVLIVGGGMAGCIAAAILSGLITLSVISPWTT